MTDEEFLAAFHDCSLTEFHHRDHVRLTWLVVTRTGVETAAATVSDGIRRFAAHHGQTAKYHETMTQFWVSLVAHHVQAYPSAGSFDGFIAKFPMLLDKSLPFRHWERETLLADEARAGWVEPDRVPMPA